MDLSFEGEPPKEANDISPEEGKENIANHILKESTNEVRDRSSRSLLWDNLISKENERLKAKIEKQVKNQEEQIVKLKEKNQILKRELQRWQRYAKNVDEDIKKLKTDNKKLKETVLSYELQTDKKANSQIEREEEQKRWKQNLQLQKEKMKKCLISLTKQYQSQLKKRQNYLEQMTKEFKQTITSKDKQIMKTEKLLSELTQNSEVTFLKQNTEIQSIKHSLEQSSKEKEVLKLKLNQQRQQKQILDLKVQQLEDKFRSHVTKFEMERKKIENEKINEIESLISKLEEIDSQIKNLFLQCQLPCCQGATPMKITSLKNHIKQRINNNSNNNNSSNQELADLRRQIDILRQSELKLKGKVNMLQEELDFTQKNQVKNDNIADIIKQHLTHHQQTSLIQKKQKLVTEPQSTGLSLKISSFKDRKQCNTIDRKEKTENYHLKGERNRFHSSSILYPKQMFVQSIQSKLLQNPKRKTIKQNSEFIDQKAELTTKKKSLIYLMNNDSKEQNQDLFRKSTLKMSSFHNKQRSCSMRELVSRRCSEHLNC